MLTALAAALAPAVIDAVKGIFGAASRKWIGLSVDDQIKLQNAEIEKVKALSALDNPYGTPSQWVVDLRGSFRYIACAIFVIGGLATMFVAPALAPIGMEAASAASSFIFGERMLLSIKGASK
jgi:hypothetical protein